MRGAEGEPLPVPQREEESLIDEMRAAIRGDRERAAARGSVAVPLLESEAAPERLADPAPEPEPEPAAESRKGAFRRLLGRG
jgi:hypothetical protein